MPLTQRQMVNLLRKSGWEKVSGGKGSHIKMVNSNKEIVIIPHGELNKFTERAIRKETGVK